jgi:glucokinase
MIFMDKPVLAVDLGGTKIRSAVISQEGKIVAIDNRLTQAYKGFDHVINRLFDAIDTVLRKECMQTGEFSGIGIAIAGVLDSKNGILTSSPNLPDWKNVPLKQTIQDRLGLDTFLINDANAAALGEHRFGAGIGAQDLVYLTVSTGIGGGIIIDDKLYEGSTGSAGELGHMTIDADGPRCNCGNYGCLEALASGTAVARVAIERIKAGKISILRDMKENITDITAEDVAKAARQEDKLANEIIAGASYYLGIGLANIVNIFNPQVIVIGGGMSKMGGMLIEPAKKIVKQRAFKLPAHTARIVRSRLGNESGIIGAAANVFSQQY